MNSQPPGYAAAPSDVFVPAAHVPQSAAPSSNRSGQKAHPSRNPIATVGAVSDVQLFRHVHSHTVDPFAVVVAARTIVVTDPRPLHSFSGQHTCLVRESVTVSVIVSVVVRVRVGPCDALCDFVSSWVVDWEFLLRVDDCVAAERVGLGLPLAVPCVFVLPDWDTVCVPPGVTVSVLRVCENFFRIAVKDSDGVRVRVRPSDADRDDDGTVSDELFRAWLAVSDGSVGDRVDSLPDALGVAVSFSEAVSVNSSVGLMISVQFG